MKNIKRNTAINISKIRKNMKGLFSIIPYK